MATLREWPKIGWNLRMEDNGIDRVMVISDIDEEDKENGGHLDCVIILTQEVEARILVTSRKWLSVIA